MPWFWTSSLQNYETTDFCFFKATRFVVKHRKPIPPHFL
jgi:hypothetical protein